MHKAPDHPEPTLQATALRYAAGDLSPGEVEAFEARLADDQSARDALSEAVRLSAAALGQSPPTPDSTFRASIRERLLGWYPGWLSRRAYRGHPLAWAGLGSVAVAASALVGLAFAERVPHPASTPPTPVATTPAPQPTAGAGESPTSHEPEPVAIGAHDPGPCTTDDPQPSVAELWAQLSTPDHAEKTHDEELRWRQRLRDSAAMAPGKVGNSGANEVRERE